ncbi:MAG TPA: DUF6728 family protein [Puia sp.]|nr:DUF6728 family protein [Puia sp.]
MGIWRQIEEYFYIKKRDPNAPNTQWMRYMHGINRISIFMFLAGIVILLLKLFVFRRHG